MQYIVARVVFVLMLATGWLLSADSCVQCHSGIEDIRHPDSQMMQQIATMGQAWGDSKGCTVCHGGDASTMDKDKAHFGAPNHPGGLEAFVRDPGSIWISDKTCGLCHTNHTPNLSKALMQTEAGKIQGNLFGWGTKMERKVTLGNYDIVDEDGQEPVWGTDAYKAYMKDMIAAHPNQFPTELKQLPLPPMDDSEFEGKSEKEISAMASLTYQRTDCQRCHVGVRGRKGRGDYRGMGCSACHIPYGNEGYYEGGDKNINSKEPGHLLVHTIQATREAKVKVHDKEFSGMHPETCNSCHNRGKRIGVSYVGLMENDYNSPLAQDGNAQSKTHGKKYHHVKDDLHFEAGMTCQDCHTSIDMHGDGNIFGTTLAQVEIECSDCHGTVEQYPWDLPLGYGEEFGRKLSNMPRGLSDALPYWMTEGTEYDKKDGYLLSARGNPLGNVVKEGDKVIAHLASGKDLEVPILKTIDTSDTWQTETGKVAMKGVSQHMDSMECYACHADWAPQCYGCHIKVDYSGDNGTDWIATGNTNLDFNNGETLESVMKDGKSKNGYKKLFGKASEERSYLRWEDPILGVNGEGRVTPIIPGCQTTFTVIGPDGKALILNKQARVPDGPNDSLVAGTDMAPVQPHTISRTARTCESCHADPKALGYGISGGKFLQKQGSDVTIDLQDLRDGSIVSKKATVQLTGTPGMDYDWSQVVTRDGKQLQTVGSHWEGSGPLPQEMRDRMENAGLCVGCHKEMSSAELWSKLDSNKKLNAIEHLDKMNELLKQAAEATKVTKLLKACAAGVTLLLLLAGCDNKVSLKEVEQKTTTQVDNETTKSVEVDTITKKPKFATYPFLDNFNLDSHGQFTVFIFGSKNCPYCEKLKEDISEDEELAFKLGQEFSTYYISMDGLTEHTLMHEKESMQTSNRVLADIYQVQATPTLIFLDKQVKSIFAVPGYMPRDQFKVTLDFITNEKWISAERGSKEMYDTIKAYYEEKGILTTKAEE